MRDNYFDYVAVNPLGRALYAPVFDEPTANSTGVKRIHHPVVGDLELSYEAFELDRASQVRVAGRRADGSSRTLVIVWHVVVDGELYLRSVKGPQGEWYKAWLATSRDSSAGKGRHERRPSPSTRPETRPSTRHIPRSTATGLRPAPSRTPFRIRRRCALTRADCRNPAWRGISRPAAVGSVRASLRGDVNPLNMPLGGR